MSASCVGTCSNCGTRRFWLSDTISLQLDDGRLVCLPHPGERFECHTYGLSLGQASARGRLYRETFYVCRTCGRGGEAIQKQIWQDEKRLGIFARNETKWCWGLEVIVVPLSLWLRWWTGVAAVGG